jgi:hypothetical protein
MSDIHFYIHAGSHLNQNFSHSNLRLSRPDTVEYRKLRMPYGCSPIDVQGALIVWGLLKGQRGVSGDAVRAIMFVCRQVFPGLRSRLHAARAVMINRKRVLQLHSSSSAPKLFERLLGPRAADTCLTIDRDINTAFTPSWKESMGRKQKAAQRKEGSRANRGGSASRQFNRLLAPLGLRLLPVAGDGNCFFRACAVQFRILGRNHAPRDICDHEKLRQRVCDFLLENRQLYAPYVEAEVASAESDAAVCYDEYVRKMRQDGVWAGHLEIHALSAMLETEIIIYLAQAPSYRIRNTDRPVHRQLQLAYHENQHYDAVLPSNIDADETRIDGLQGFVVSETGKRSHKKSTTRRRSAAARHRGDFCGERLGTENMLRVLEL